MGEQKTTATADPEAGTNGRRARTANFGALAREQLTAIAQRSLGFDTLESRHSDSLDFRDVGCWSAASALAAAYRAGQADLLAAADALLTAADAAGGNACPAAVEALRAAVERARAAAEGLDGW